MEEWIWVTEYAQNLAQEAYTNPQYLEEEIQQWQNKRLSIEQQKKEGVSKREYLLLESSYEAIQVAVNFLEKYRQEELYRLPEKNVNALSYDNVIKEGSGHV